MAEDWTDKAGDLIEARPIGRGVTMEDDQTRMNRETIAKRAGERAVIAAAREFVAKVERGEAKSVKSYAAFKAALDQLDAI